MSSVRKFAIAMTVFASLISLSSCSGNNSGTTQPAAVARQSTVKLFITDAENDKFNQILVTITDITLIAPDGTNQLVSTTSTTIDLRKMTDFFQFLAQNGVNSGNYSKIRLTVGKIVLNQVDSNGNIIATQTVTPPSGKIDIIPSKEISLSDGGQQSLVMDFDANHSFKLVTTGNGKIVFRPVIFLHQLGDHESMPGRMARLHGAITSPDLMNFSFKLCSMDHERPDECLTVEFDDTTLMYDPNLAPITPNDLVENTEIEVFGHLEKDGMETHIRASILVLGPDGTLSYARGQVSTAPDAQNLMSVNVKSGQTIPAGDTSVQLVDPVKIFSRSTGKLLTMTDLTAGTPVMVIGQYDANSSLFTAIAVSVADQRDEVTGTVTAVKLSTDGQTKTLTINTPSGDQCVTVNQATRIAIDDGSEDDQVTLGTATNINVGQKISVRGALGADQCITAASVVTSGS